MGTPDCVVHTVRCATADDLPAIVALYERVIAHMRVNPPDVWWDMDAHPTVERLERETAEGNLFVAAGEPLLGAFIIDDTEGLRRGPLPHSRSIRRSSSPWSGYT